MVVTAAVLVAAGLTTTVLLTRSGGTQAASPPPGQRLTPTTARAPAFPYVPLYPFGSRADVAEWQESYRNGGHDPWHLDAGLTALSFTQGYLGYAGVDKVVGVVASPGDDRVSVGYADPNGRSVVAAVLHLVRFGSGTDAPWEVVGTRDTVLTLTTPAYGAVVRSPMTVGGSVTGVDENLRVQVRQLDEGGPVGQSGGVPAGGDRAPWTTRVSFAPAHHGVLTVAVATG
jgi:hypothetical protein